MGAVLQAALPLVLPVPPMKKPPRCGGFSFGAQSDAYAALPIWDWM